MPSFSPETYYRHVLDQRPPDLAARERLWDRRAAEVSAFTVSEADPALAAIRERMDLSGKSVLDISFGAGRHLLEFLRLGAQIHGVEISSGMIQQAHAKLGRSGLAYTPDHLVQSAWETLDLDAYGWRAAFDLVFLNMSPAISSVAMLEKVLAASRRLVSISLYTQREDSLLQDLMVGFGLSMGSPHVKVAEDFPALFNLLYLWGYLPQIRFETRIRTHEHDPDAMLERYASWLWPGDAATPMHRQALRDTLHHRAIHGKITTTSRDIVGHLLVDITCRI